MGGGGISLSGSVGGGGISLSGIAIGNYNSTNYIPYNNSVCINSADSPINNTNSNVIAINASGNTLVPLVSGGCYIAPVRVNNNYNSSLLYLGTGEVFNDVFKSFVIDHPTDANKYLVHACLEGPEAGVYYRGEGKITNNECTTISLPDYVNPLAYNFTIQITHIYDGEIKTYNSGRVINNQFNVYGENGEFYWVVHGTRQDIEVEVDKKTAKVKGNGPYLWI